MKQPKAFDLKKVVSILWEIESRYDLFSQKIDDIYFWKVIRFHLNINIQKKLYLLDEPHSLKYKNLFIAFLQKCYYSITKNPFLGKQKDILVFQGGRKVLYKSSYVDQYTHFLKLPEGSYELIAKDNRGTYLHTNKKEKWVDSIMLLAQFLKIYYRKVTFNEEQQDLINKVNTAINTTYTININLSNLVKKEITVFKAYYILYKKLLKKKKPKQIYLVCSYGMESLIKAAKELDIEVIECQHGSTSKIHVGYGFPDKKYIPYFPDKLIMFGKYWYDESSLPLAKDKIKIEGYGYLNHLKKELQNKKIKKSVLFISQGTIGKKLFKVALEFATLNPAFKITYKLHPGEINLLETIYEPLAKKYSLQNFKIAKKDCSIYELQSYTEYQVGVYSTSLVEGIVFNCKTIVYKLTGYELFSSCIDQGIFSLAENISELNSIVNDGTKKTVDSNYFFYDKDNQ